MSVAARCPAEMTLMLPMGPPKQREARTPVATTIVEGSKFNLKVEDGGQRASYHVEKLGTLSLRRSPGQIRSMPSI